MRNLLSLILLLAAVTPAVAGPASGGVKVFSSGGSSSTGTHTDGGNASFKSVVAETLQSTGTAPSLTATGAHFRSSVTIHKSIAADAIPLLSIKMPAGLSVGTQQDGMAFGRTFASGDSALSIWTGDDSSFIQTTAWGASFTSKNLNIQGKGGNVGIGGNGIEPTSTLQNHGTTALLGATTISGSSLSVTGNAYVSGNLGLGSASPSAKLHCSSCAVKLDGTGAKLTLYPATADTTDLQFNAAAWANGDRHKVSWTSGDTLMGSIGVEFDSVASPPEAFFSIGDLYSGGGADALVVRGVNGLVGIGTNAPGAKLDVAGDAQFGSGVNKATVTAGGFWQPLSQTTDQAALLAPTAVGQYIDNSTLGALCRSTGTSAGNWAIATAAGTGCY